MLFNSFAFAIFFPITTLLYFLIPHRFRWILLLVASCIFYMWFVPTYILILAITIIIDYVAGIQIENSTGKTRKAYLIGSIISTCLVLFSFKYFNFFATNLTSVVQILKWNYSISTLNVILPIGLSFHTFQSLSYVIEVYRGHQKAERNFGIYALFVMFYPQLVAGPIERPQNLLHQFYQEHHFKLDRVIHGLKLICWGLIKKVVISDRLAVLVNHVYADPTRYNGLTLVLATYFFAFQIYCDFSGYSDIARGTARVMGFELMRNFNAPYLSRSISEFWKKWHISLSTWFKDYLYISLGGNRCSTTRWYFNLFFTFLVSGFWHGASWTYVIWGALNGFYLVFSLWTNRVRTNLSNQFGFHNWPRLVAFCQTFLTFNLISFSWIFFRANSVQDAFYIVSHLFKTGSGVNILPERSILGFKMGVNQGGVFLSITLLFFLYLIDYIQGKFRIEKAIKSLPPYIRWPIYYAAVLVIIFLGVYGENQFIYFQF